MLLRLAWWLVKGCTPPPSAVEVAVHRCHCHWHQLTSMYVCCSGAVTFQPTITKTYNTSNLLEDIKGLYKLAGLKGQKVHYSQRKAVTADAAWLVLLAPCLLCSLS